MVSCKHCATPNTLDSTFCKRCGTGLPEAEIQLAQEKLVALVAEGIASFNEGRTDEAMAVAESALQSNPSYVAALSLKGDCHARRGEVAEALECAERIVSLNPDSELDKIKRNQLRNALVTNLQVPPGTDRGRAILQAVAAAALVISLGAFIARGLQKNEQAAVADNSHAGSYEPLPQPATIVPSTQPQAPSSNQTQSNPVQNNPQDSRRDVPAVTADQNDSLPPYTGATLPLPGNTAIPPVTIEPPEIPKAKAPDKTPQRGIDPPPVIETPADAVKADEGEYSIQVHGGTRPRVRGGSEPVTSSNGTEALVRTGNQQFQVGNFQAAASSFERAAGSGADPIGVYPRLAQAYDHLGRTSDAISAYSRAISACEAAQRSGRGNRDRIQNVLEMSRAALKALQGG